MSDFFKLAYDLIAKIVYFLVEWVVNFFKGFVQLFVTGWADYIAIFNSYYGYFNLPLKILSIILMVILVAIPIVLIVIIVRKIVISIQLRAVRDDNNTLYREIGRLNKQVLELMDEKNKILAMKVNSVTGAPIPAGLGVEGAAVAGAPAAVAGAVAGAPIGGIPDPLADPLAPMPASGYAAGNAVGAMPMSGMTVAGGIDEDALSAAAAAAATAAASAKSMADEKERSSADRFPKLSLVDARYMEYEPPEFDNDVTLQQFTENYRLFAASQMHLYYTEEIVRRFIAGMASSKLLILEGISGTGKTSLPYSFSRYLNNPATMVSVQPSFRDRTELLGYFNEFSKRFNETEFLRALYEANYREDPCFIVLDEMNLARIEYYFAEMLSVLELPSADEWVLDLVPTAWPGDPAKLESGKVRVPTNIWFVGTANNDDSTFTITDKVYDRAMPIELNERANAFECDLQPRCCVTAKHLEEMFEQAKQDHPISERTLSRMIQLDGYLQTRFKLAFGNRIMKQMYEFIPVYVACGGTELGGLDYIIARKVLKKFESQNVTFVRDEIKGLIAYFEKNFGKTAMPDSRMYLERIQNLY